ncbi:MAG: TetR/AcrR family transcriptional regulator [bacterium]|nr:TetR/AcrR family transcriptional regulator [bacterium]
MNTKPKHLPAAERRAATVAAVIALAARHNPSEITTGAIAQYMHLTQGALFRHFSSKDAIWQAVMEWVAEGLLERVDQAASLATSPLAALEAMFFSHVEFISAHPGVPRIMFGELQRAGATPAKEIARELVQTYRSRLSRCIEQGKAQGELRSDLEVEVAVTLFIGIIQGLLVQAMLAGDLDSMRRTAPRVFTIFRRGIQTEP